MRPFPYWGWGAVILILVLFILILTHTLHFGVSAEIWPNGRVTSG
jgi:hypothetical protein